MAHAIRTGQVTPADDLRALLDINEKRVANLPGSGMAAVDLLHDLDRIAGLWPELTAQGIDLQPEAGRWETLQAAVRRNAREIVRQARSAGGFPVVHPQDHSAGEAAWWWRLEDHVRAQAARRATRRAGALAIVVVAGLALHFLLRVLFPIDPAVQAAQAALATGEDKIAQQRDFAGAAADFRRAADITPDDAATWLRLGAALEQSGDPAAAADAYQRGAALVGNDVDFRTARASVYLAFDMLDAAEADLQIVIAVAPENALAHYYLASVYEGRGATDAAVAALARAAELAEHQKDAQLEALARVRMGILMQRSLQDPAAAPASTP